jgi:hypothetical protein
MSSVKNDGTLAGILEWRACAKADCPIWIEVAAPRDYISTLLANPHWLHIHRRAGRNFYFVMLLRLQRGFGHGRLLLCDLEVLNEFLQVIPTARSGAYGWQLISDAFAKPYLPELP